MDFNQWDPYYKKILSDFDISIYDDEKSAGILNQLLHESDLVTVSDLVSLIKNNEVYVFGAGPSLEHSIIRYKNELLNKVNIAADGATSALLENNVVPDIIVTDLDGNVSDQLKANNDGSIVLIHAHGDNIKKIKEYVQNFNGKIIGTTQTNPDLYENLYNFGGFTDGDRAVYLADHFLAKKINLIGFDFGTEIGKYSFAEHKDIKLKLKKLEWCKRLIDSLDNNRIRYL